MQKDISIEYAHIYTNNRIGEEQRNSLDILQNISREFGDQQVSLVVMVDDYSFPDASFDYDMFSRWLTENKFKPDCIIRESELIPYCDKVLDIISDQYLKNQISEYILRKRYPCSLFIATWYLLRLGCIENNLFSKDLVATRLINILPMSFKPYEDKAFEILSKTRFRSSVNQIKNRYFKGRAIE
jgi:hypothetical protein